jgi:UDP-GlcNAc:undecaprenyl-phosphate/decaprenyl-phosphate GlcNAc-1-phosphate transferase
VPYSLQLALVTAVATLALVPLARALAIRVGAVDHPGPRRVHREPVPTMGGLAFVVTVLAMAWAARVLPGPAYQLDPQPLLGLTLAALPLLALGIVDDTRGAHWLAKLGVQACAALVLVQFGYGVPVLTNPFGSAFPSGALNAPLTVLWVLAVINAINLIDGIDGLAAGVVLIASCALWFTGRLHGDFYVMFITSLLIGGTAGFLRYNFPPARVFMGDTGSHFLGLVLAAVSLLENRKGTAAVTLLFPLVAMGVPMMDSVSAFVRRARRGQPVFHADAGHVHHRLLRLGLSPRRALLALWGLSALLALVAVGLTRLPRGLTALGAVALAVALFLAFEWLETLDRRRGGGA